MQLLLVATVFRGKKKRKVTLDWLSESSVSNPDFFPSNAINPHRPGLVSQCKIHAIERVIERSEAY